MSWSVRNASLTPSASGTVAAHIKSAPVDVERLASDLGLRVFYNPRLRDDISGKIFRCDEAKAGYCVEINAQHYGNRKRFTLAHEIAHYVLHRDLIGDGITDDAMYLSTLSNDLEAQANRYAADILLPATLLSAEFRRDPSLSYLSNTFRVSLDALRIRLKQIGLGA